jgi:hypothetical protein
MQFRHALLPVLASLAFHVACSSDDSGKSNVGDATPDAAASGGASSGAGGKKGSGGATSSGGAVGESGGGTGLAGSQGAGGSGPDAGAGGAMADSGSGGASSGSGGASAGGSSADSGSGGTSAGSGGASAGGSSADSGSAGASSGNGGAPADSGTNATPDATDYCTPLASGCHDAVLRTPDAGATLVACDAAGNDGDQNTCQSMQDECTNACGTAVCNILKTLCHTVDPGSGRIHTCHVMGHQGVAANCFANAADCIQVCNDAHQAGTGGASGAGGATSSGGSSGAAGTADASTDSGAH